MLPLARQPTGDSRNLDPEFVLAPSNSDPVAALFVDKLRLTYVGAFLFGVLLVTIVDALSILAYWVFLPDRLRDFLIWQFGTWYNFVSFWIVYPLITATYPWMIRVSRTIYAQLYSVGVIPKEVQGVQATVKSVGDISNHLGWQWAAIAFAVILEVAFAVEGVTSLWPKTPGIGKDLWVFFAVGAPASLLGMYIIASIVSRAVVIVIGLNRIFRRLEQGAVWEFIKPWHPDKCGGMGTISDYAVRVSWFIAACGLFVFLYLYSSLRTTSVASTGSFGSVLSASLVNNPTVWVDIVIYLSLSPALFFGTLGAAHKAMNRAKQEHLKVISGKLNDEYKAIYDKIRSTSASGVPSIDAVKNLHELYRLAQAFPVWPFDVVTMRRFMTAVFAPIVTVIGSASIEVFVLHL